MQKKIAIVSRGDAQTGGASRVADELAKLLNGQDRFIADHWLGMVKGSWESHFRKMHGGSALRFIYQATNWFSLQAGYPDFFTPEGWIHALTKSENYQLYHFHDISRTVSPRFIRKVSRAAPVIWTFHDCSPFTGGCLYPYECQRLESGCGNCPQLNIWPLKTRIDRTRFLLEYKKKTAASADIVPIAPSEWMASQAMRSGMFDERPEVIPYSVDLDLFKTRSKSSLREEFGLDESRINVLLNVFSLADPRKGVADGIKALKELKDRPMVIAIGSIEDDDKILFDGLETRFLGYVNDRELLARYTAVADVLLFPTYADNLPNSVLEAMASGTPTIGYKTGGMPDMVEHGVNGWLAETGDVDSLVEGLELVQTTDGLQKQWGLKCREKAVSTFSPAAFLDAHEKLYDRVLSSRLTDCENTLRQ